MKQVAEIVQETFSTRRMENLTDGVFAISMTLLILIIGISQLGDASSSTELSAAIYEKLPAVFGLIVGFLLLGSMWTVHMRQFEHVTKTDRHLIMINLIRLLTVVLIPLTTYIGVTYGDITLGRVLLPVNFLLLAIVSYWEWSYAVHSKSKLANKVSRDLRHQSTIRNLTIIVMAIIVIILAVYIGQLAFVIFLLIPLISNYVHRRVDLRER